MMAAIKSEFRKLLTVRSTYVIVLLCLAILVFFAFWIEGIRAVPTAGLNPNLLASEVTSAIQALGLFMALVGVLLFTHEYRYNTVIYTLTAARRRWQVLIAKVIVASVFLVILSLIIGVASPYLTQLGLHIKDIQLVPQDFPLRELLMHGVFYAWGYGMLALIIAMLVRNQVGSLVVLLLFPSLGETLLGLLLKDNAKYLPFNALGRVLQNGQVPANMLSYTAAVVVVLGYIVLGWIVAFTLFAKRDAN